MIAPPVITIVPPVTIPITVAMPVPIVVITITRRILAPLVLVMFVVIAPAHQRQQTN